MNTLTKQIKKTIDEAKSTTEAVLIFIFAAILLCIAAYLGFWLFTWAVFTLFHFEIAMTAINYLAFAVLMWILKAGCSGS